MKTNSFKRSILAVVVLTIGFGACNPFGEEDEISSDFSPASTEPEPDTASPTAPSSLSLSGNTTLDSTPTLSWTASTDDTGIDHYKIALGSSSGGSDLVAYTNVGNVTSYQFTSLAANLSVSGAYYISVKAFDAAGNESEVATSSSFAPALVTTGGGYYYPNDSYAVNCLEYINSDYYNAQGDDLYWIDPDGAGANSEFLAYCDMTNDGGGWTLIGRGREDWDWDDNGKNTTDVHLDVGTTMAFTPSYYEATVVDDIIEGSNVSALTDGLRIKRALDTTGTTYQEYVWHFTSQTNYTWVFDGAIAVSDCVIDSVSFGANDTRDTTEDGNNENRVFTWGWASHASLKGFAYGSSVSAGTNSSTNFLWENGSENHSIPYAEVYVRQ